MRKELFTISSHSRIHLVPISADQQPHLRRLRRASASTASSTRDPVLGASATAPRPTRAHQAPDSAAPTVPKRCRQQTQTLQVSFQAYQVLHLPADPMLIRGQCTGAIPTNLVRFISVQF